MMLIEQTQVPDAALPVATFRDHLQLGSGFADDGLQDPVLTTCLRAALAAVEADTSKALFARDFKLTVAAWRDFARQALPMAPVTAIQSVTMKKLVGGNELVSPDAYRLVPDYYRPVLEARGWSLPVIPDGATAEIVFTAGFGPAWSDLPPDIAQAVLMLAAHFYDNRGALTDRASPLPHGISALLKRYRPVRILGGGA